MLTRRTSNVGSWSALFRNFHGRGFKSFIWSHLSLPLSMGDITRSVIKELKSQDNIWAVMIGSKKLALGAIFAFMVASINAADPPADPFSWYVVSQNTCTRYMSLMISNSGPGKPCKLGCCGTNNVCGMGPDYCSPGKCVSECTAKRWRLHRNISKL